MIVIVPYMCEPIFFASDIAAPEVLLCERFSFYALRAVLDVLEVRAGDEG